MVTLETSIKDLNRLGLLTVRSMNVCRNGGIETLGQLLAIDKIELLKVPNCGRKTLMELDVLRTNYETALAEEKQSKIIEDIELATALNKFNYLSPTESVKLKTWVEWRYAKLSVRAKNAFPKLSNSVEALTAIYSAVGVDILSVKNCGKKTQTEITAYLNDVRSHFEEVTQGIDTTSEEPRVDDIEKEIVELGQEFPFLLTKECESIVDFRKQNAGLTPYLYIVKLYILRSENPRISIYRDYYGLNISLTRFSLSEIGEKNNLSRERVRQIVSRELPLPKSLCEHVKQYLDPQLGNVVAFDSLFWNKIQKDNFLQESYSQTALLVCALLDSHTIIQIDDEDKEYLVRKSIVENVKVRNVLNNISRVIALRRTTIEQLDIMQYIKSEGRLYHKDVRDLCVIYANFLKRKYDVEIDNERYITILPNALDISYAIENILEQRGIPMSLDELLSTFNQLYPENEFDSPLKFKPYILRNPNIRPKGKTGIYILKNWKNHFTGTLTSYLEHILRTFDEPVSLDDLEEFALEEFPNTNKKSIYSLIIGDKDSRYIVYEDEYVGLADKHLPDFNKKERRIIKRHSFDSRFDDFKDFVITHKRLPIQTGSDEEQSLSRWMTNVLKANVDSTEEQRLSLQNFLSENNSIPQNGTEYNFKQMCDRIKVIVNKTFELPSVTELPSEYQWLRKNIEKYADYEDNRKTYFEDLLSYLRDFGFYF